MTNSVILYYTDGCHLCEDAILVIEALNLSYQKIDIVEQAVLVEQYATRIPVVENKAGAVLGWPFSRQTLKQFVCDGE